MDMAKETNGAGRMVFQKIMENALVLSPADIGNQV